MRNDGYPQRTKARQQLLTKEDTSRAPPHHLILLRNVDEDNSDNIQAFYFHKAIFA